MKATGIIRRLDDLGRVVIPKELRRSMGVGVGDPLEIFLSEEGGVVLQPYHSEASSKLRAIAETLNSVGHTPEHWDIADEIKAIAEKLTELENRE